MPVGEQTVGSITSAYPGAETAFTAQTETSDPVSEDPDYAEGRDWNKQAAGIQALEAVLGIGGQGALTVDAGTPDCDIAALRVFVDGALVVIAETLAVALGAGLVNYIYADLALATPAFAVATGGFPAAGASRYVPLAIWDDSGGSPVLTDARPQRQADSMIAAAGLAGVLAGGGNGGILKLAIAEAVKTGSGATLTATGLYPAGCIRLGVATRVITADGGAGAAATMDVGDGSDVDAYGAAVGLVLADTTDLADHTASPLGLQTAAGDVVLTANGGTFDAISVRVQAAYLQLVAPTS